MDGSCEWKRKRKAEINGGVWGKRGCNHFQREKLKQCACMVG